MRSAKEWVDQGSGKCVTLSEWIEAIQRDALEAAAKICRGYASDFFSDMESQDQPVFEMYEFAAGAMHEVTKKIEALIPPTTSAYGKGRSEPS